MALKEIRQYVAPRVGFSNIDGNEEQINLVNTRINEAAREIYDETDLPGSLMECFVQVEANQTIALPQFIGPLRGIREPLATQDSSTGPPRTRPWSMQLLVPRYNFDNWEKRWTKWSFRGISPIQRTITNAGILTFAMSVADAETLVYVTGATAAANAIQDVVTMSSTSVNGTKQFIRIDSINARAVRDNDITITDNAGNVLAVLFNNALETGYQIYDISQFPMHGFNGAADNCLEILYKKPLFTMSEDNHCFPVPGYDIIIGKKTVQLFVEDKAGQEERAFLMDKRITRDINRKSGDQQNSIVRTIQFADDGLLDMRNSLNWDD